MMIAGMIEMTLADAEKIEESVTEAEAPAWMAMLDWAASDPIERRTRQPHISEEPAVVALPDARRRQFLAALCRMVEHAGRPANARVLVMG